MFKQDLLEFDYLTDKVLNEKNMNNEELKVYLDKINKKVGVIHNKIVKKYVTFRDKSKKAITIDLKEIYKETKCYNDIKKAIPTDNLIAYYPFYHNAKDYYGNYDGIIYNNIIFDDGALFDGYSYIDISNVSDVLDNENFTISFFAKKSVIPEEDETIVSIGDIIGRNVLIVGFNKIFHYLSSEEIQFTPNLNKYNFYVLIFDNDKISFYLNNKLIVKNKDFGVTFNSNQKIYIGTDKKDDGTLQMTFEGKVKDFFIFNKNLNLTTYEVNFLYNKEAFFFIQKILNLKINIEYIKKPFIEQMYSYIFNRLCNLNKVIEERMKNEANKT